MAVPQTGELDSVELGGRRIQHKSARRLPIRINTTCTQDHSTSYKLLHRLAFDYFDSLTALTWRLCDAFLGTQMCCRNHQRLTRRMPEKRRRARKNRKRTPCCWGRMRKSYESLRHRVHQASSMGIHKMDQNGHVDGENIGHLPETSRNWQTMTDQHGITSPQNRGHGSDAAGSMGRSTAGRTDIEWTSLRCVCVCYCMLGFADPRCV